ncbi:MAG: Glycosyltransferase [uncultured bacterium]|nr:MAG: Glycosyltransferase [uncultured bacterium]
MKIAIVSGASKKGDSVRGIGAHYTELLRQFNQLKIKNYKLKIVEDTKLADVVHFTVFRPYFISLPFFKPKNTKFILTIHDLIMLVYPKQYPSGIRGRIRFEINKYLIKKYVDRIITISETSKKDICRFLDVKPEIVDVVYIAPKKVMQKLEKGKWVDEIKFKYNLPDRFVLFDHGVNYNKNVPTLIKACRIAKIQLVIFGKEIENLDKLDLNHAELKHLKDVDFSDVVKLGYVSDEDLNKLFNLAYIYVQPSFYEGFGMPVVEAMTVGCPVIASKTQALVEVCGDACLYFDSYNVNDLVNKLKLFTENLQTRNKYIKKGFERVKKFSWEKVAKETLDVYAKA